MKFELFDVYIIFWVSFDTKLPIVKNKPIRWPVSIAPFINFFQALANLSAKNNTVKPQWLNTQKISHYSKSNGILGKVGF